MNKDANILIVGHQDIIEESLHTFFSGHGYTNIFSVSRIGLDPAIQSSVYAFFQNERPEVVILASTRSGGIEANIRRPAEFMYHNVEAQNNVIYASWKFGVKKLLYVAGSCVYPKECPQPMSEEHLLTGPLEETSEPYSLAKIAGIKMCQAFKRQYGLNAVVMVPATVYGPGSDTAAAAAHVLGALVKKFGAAVRAGQREVTVWGTGRPRREFLYADDFARACLFLLEHYDGDEMLNAGCGRDVSIRELAGMIAGIAGFRGKIVFDASRPDGTMQKLLDSRRINGLGWKARVSLEEGLQKTYEWYTHSLKEGVNA